MRGCIDPSLEQDKTQNAADKDKKISVWQAKAYRIVKE